MPFVSLNDFSGLTVDPMNSIALKQAIEKIIYNKQLYESFSSNALERVKLFSRIKMAEAYKNIYEI